MANIGKYWWVFLGLAALGVLLYFLLKEDDTPAIPPPSEACGGKLGAAQERLAELEAHIDVTDEWKQGIESRIQDATSSLYNMTYEEGRRSEAIHFMANSEKPKWNAKCIKALKESPE